MYVKQPAPPVFIRDKQVKEFFGISATHARRLSKAGLFAERRNLSPGIAGYFYEEGKRKLLELPTIPNVEELLAEVIRSESK